MWPVLIAVGAAMAGMFGLIATSKNRHEERLKKIPGGESTVNSVKLVSANYQGRVKVTGKGVPVHAYGESWEECEFELKLAAAEAKCNIVIDVKKEGSRRDGFSFSGTAFRKY